MHAYVHVSVLVFMSVWEHVCDDCQPTSLRFLS